MKTIAYGIIAAVGLYGCMFAPRFVDRSVGLIIFVCYSATVGSRKD